MADALPDWPALMKAPLAAAYLSVGTTYFLNTIAQDVPPIRRGRSVVLYLRRDLDGWIDRQVGGGAGSLPATDSWAGV